MKTKLITRVPNMVAILAFLALLAGNAFAIENSSRVVSPYWQSDTTSYTFIAVSHTSLSGMASQIGVTVNAFSSDQSTAGAAFGSAVTFTITAGSTERIFITRTGHTTVNSTNIPTANFISGTTNFEHGHIRIDPIATTPTTTTSNAGLTGHGYRDATMLSFWGAVVVEQNSTGFAMEFIGDMHDSAAAGVLDSRSGISVTGPAAP
jgi:hypothetical protein